MKARYGYESGVRSPGTLLTRHQKCSFSFSCGILGEPVHSRNRRQNARQIGETPVVSLVRNLLKCDHMQSVFGRSFDNDSDGLEGGSISEVSYGTRCIDGNWEGLLRAEREFLPYITDRPE